MEQRVCRDCGAPWDDSAPNEQEKARDEPRNEAVVTAEYGKAVSEVLNNLFDRYDLDGSGDINSTEELRQLTHNMIYKLRKQGFQLADLKSQLVVDLCDAQGLSLENRWEKDKFEAWFVEHFKLEADGGEDSLPSSPGVSPIQPPAQALVPPGQGVGVAIELIEPPAMAISSPEGALPGTSDGTRAHVLN